MVRSPSLWEVADALEYVWRELRHMPISATSELSTPWIEALKAVSQALTLIDSEASSVEIAEAKKDIALAFCTLRLKASTTEIHAALDKIRDGVLDAGTNLTEWV